MLPNEKWKLEINDKTKSGGILYMYTRTPIINKQNQEIQPVIAFIIEDLPNDSIDLVTYSILKRSDTPLEVKEIFTWEKNKLVFKNAIGYKSIYNDKNNTEHTTYVIHLINDHKGVQVIMDITSDLFNEYEEEFLKTLKSIEAEKI